MATKKFKNGGTAMRKLILLLTTLLLVLPAVAQQRPCLIVRQAEGHRFRNSMIAGALTGGIGFVAGGLSGGARYEYVDAINMSSGVKMKYKGDELNKLANQGVHVITVNKKGFLSTGNNPEGEVVTGRQACAETAPAPAVVPAIPTPAPAPVGSMAAAAGSGNDPAPMQMSPMLRQPDTTRTFQQPAAVPVAVPAVQESLGEAAKRNQQHKACLVLAADNPSITCQ